MNNRIYFAAPLFNDAEKSFNIMLAEILEQSGYEVFLPQRDDFEAATLTQLSEEEKGVKIFAKDISEVKRADILFMVLDGRVPDDGACVELGVAYALGKACYAIKMDVRALQIGLDLNPMISGCFKKIFKYNDNQSAVTELQSYLTKQSL